MTKAEREAAETQARMANNTRAALISEANTLRSAGRSMLADELNAFAVAARSDELLRFPRNHSGRRIECKTRGPKTSTYGRRGLKPPTLGDHRRMTLENIA